MGLDESQMAHHDVKNFVIPVSGQQFELISDHLDMSFSVAHVLLGLHLALAISSNLLSLNEKFVLIIFFVVRVTVHILKL